LYDQELSFLNPISANPGRVPHLYVVRPEDRASLRAHLQAQGVDTAIHYPQALTRHSFLALNGLGGPCPVAERAVEHVLSLPCHPGMHMRAAERVVEACLAWRRDVRV
jgi:dTDP-4-amino-4,6-dideoxygalactose transaminase